MKSKQTIICAILLFSMLFLALIPQGVYAVQEKNYVIINSKDWRDLYLGTMYAGLTDKEIVRFSSLGDAQIKLKLIPLESKIELFETSKNPVIKNYESVLKINGYTAFKSTKFNGYEDLQEFLFKGIDTKGIVVLEPKFGLSSIILAPYIIKERNQPVFLTRKTKDYVKKKSTENSLIAGFIPVRLTEDLNGKKIFGNYFDINKELMDFTASKEKSDWGIIMKADAVELNSLKEGKPIFLYFGSDYINDVANSIKKSGITNFEVVGTDTSKIAKELESRSKIDLKLLLKYGRTITHFKGLEGKILDIDRVFFDFPFENLDIKDITYYPNLKKIGITFQNTGNVDISFFTNAEYKSVSISDKKVHTLLEGQTKTIPFDVNITKNTSSNELALVTTRYGLSLPFKKGLANNDGSPIYKRKVSLDKHTETPKLIFKGSSFDKDRGILFLKYENPGKKDIQIFSEISVSEDTILTSKLTTIKANTEKTIEIEMPYIPNEVLFDSSFKLDTYFGEKDTLNSQEQTIIIKEPAIGLTGFISKITGENVSVIYIILAILIILGLFLFFKKRKKGKKHSKQKVTFRF